MSNLAIEKEMYSTSMVAPQGKTNLEIIRLMVKELESQQAEILKINKKVQSQDQSIKNIQQDNEVIKHDMETIKQDTKWIGYNK